MPDLSPQIRVMGMEQETRDFLIRIINTISIVLLWMLVNVFIGIYKGFAFFDGHPRWPNFLFYAFFLAGLIWMVRYLMKKWKL